MQVWPRPEPPVAPQRNRTPSAEKERSRWLEGDQGAGKITQAWPATLVGNMADRAGDIQEWLVDTRRREPDQWAECLMRVKGHRRLAPGAVQRYVWAARQQTSAWGTLPIELARQPERPPRPVTLAVTATPVTFQGARRLGGPRPPVTVSAV